MHETCFIRDYKQRLCDCFRQEWNVKICGSERFAWFRSFKYTLQCENYLSDITIKKFRDAYIRFRLGNNCLLVNARSKDRNHENSICPFCEERDNETHFLFICSAYSEIRRKYLGKYIQQGRYPEISILFGGQDIIKLRNVAMYIFYAFKHREEKLSQD